MDIISRLLGCAGQAADAVSAYTQVKMEDAPTLMKIPKSECPDIWIRPPRHKWPKSWSSMEDPVVPLGRNLYGHPLAGLIWERHFEKVLWEHGWGKFQIVNAYSLTEKKDCSCLCMWMFFWLERNRTSTQCRKYEWKTLVWENRHHSLTTFIRVALKENVKQAKILWKITGICLNPESLQEQKKSYPTSENLAQAFPHGLLIYRARIVSATNDGSKSNGCHLQTARVRRTSSRSSIGLYPSENGGCSQIIENQKSECPDIWIRLPRHKWPKSWSSMEDPVVPLERNLYGHPLAGLIWERHFEKVLSEHGWGKFQIVNAYSLTEKKDCSCLCMWMFFLNWLERNRTSTQCGKYSWETLIWENRHHSLTTFIRVALKENVKQAKILWKITGICLNPESLQEQKQSYPTSENLTQTFPHGLMIWMVMQRNAWKGVANWRIKQLSSYIKSQHHALATTNSRRKKYDLSENCERFAHNLFWHACTWRALVDLIFCGLWTNLLVLSPSGPEHVTNA